jgi:ABC-type glutathione transport system ATPase component
MNYLKELQQQHKKMIDERLCPSSQIEIQDMILRLNKESETTVLISSYNLNCTTEISKRLVLLEKGLVKWIKTIRRKQLKNSTVTSLKRQI